MQLRMTWEDIFAVVGLAYFCGVFAPLTQGITPGGTYTIEGAMHGNPIEQIAGTLVYVVSCYLLIKQGQNPLRLILARPTLAVFLLIVVCSVSWSAVPNLTVRRGFGLVGTALFATYLASRYDLADVLRMLVTVFAAAIAMSIILIVLVSDSVISEHARFGGVFGHKNELGRAMAFSAIAFWAAARDPKFPNSSRCYIALGASVVMSLLSDSAQSILVLGLCFAFVLPLLGFVAGRCESIDWRLIVMCLAASVPAYFAFSGISDEVLALLGRDATLTDRTVIWELLVDFGWERPWLGHGYGAFWASEAAFYFGDRWKDLDHAHNGYMDLWLELGFVGLGAFAALLVTANLKAWNALLAQPRPALKFFPAFIIAGIIFNFVGRVFPEHNSIWWVLLCYCVLMRQHMRVPRRHPRFAAHGVRNLPAQRLSGS